jgi:UDP-N-acetylmuramoyl-L-alanyl-D-glutamate--2,6-diaminopimelate ligase
MSIAAARLLGVPSEICAKAVAKIERIEGRMEAIYGDVTVIIDYAHTPMAFENALFLINTAKKAEQNIITVFGCGGERDKSKRPKMAAIAEKYSDFVIVTSDNSRNESVDNILKDIVSGFRNPSAYTVIKSREEAIEYAILNSTEGDVIALLGKGHERYSIVNNCYIPFDERSIVFNSLKKRSKKSDNQP